MPRYRFVEDGLMIGGPETNTVVKQARQHLKLWNCFDANNNSIQDVQRYKDLIARSGTLMFEGLREFLEQSDEKPCQDCQRRQSYGAETSHAFGGVQLCKKCREEWGAYVESFPDRFAKVFPEVKNVMSVSADSPLEN
jgi:hypothetical protein